MHFVSSYFIHTYIRTYIHTYMQTYIHFTHTHTHTDDILETVWSIALEISTRELRKFFDNMRVVRGVFTPAVARGALYCMIQVVRVDSMSLHPVGLSHAGCNPQYAILR